MAEMHGLKLTIVDIMVKFYSHLSLYHSVHTVGTGPKSPI